RAGRAGRAEAVPRRGSRAGAGGGGGRRRPGCGRGPRGAGRAAARRRLNRRGARIRFGGDLTRTVPRPSCRSRDTPTSTSPVVSWRVATSGFEAGGGLAVRRR